MHQRVIHDRVFNSVVAMNDLVAQADGEAGFGQALANIGVGLRHPLARFAKNLPLPLDGRAHQHVRIKAVKRQTRRKLPSQCTAVSALNGCFGSRLGIHRLSGRIDGGPQVGVLNRTHKQGSPVAKRELQIHLVQMGFERRLGSHEVMQ